MTSRFGSYNSYCLTIQSTFEFSLLASANLISVVPVLSTGTKSNSSTSNFILAPDLELELEQ